VRSHGDSGIVKARSHAVHGLLKVFPVLLRRYTSQEYLGGNADGRQKRRGDGEADGFFVNIGSCGRDIPGEEGFSAALSAKTRSAHARRARYADVPSRKIVGRLEPSAGESESTVPGCVSVLETFPKRNGESDWCCRRGN